MKTFFKNLSIAAVIVIFAVICSINQSVMNPVGSLWSLFPPVVAIGLALITKEAYSSLFIGIFVGALLANGFHPITTVDSIINDGFIAAVSGQAGIFIFLIQLGIMVALINQGGGSRAFGRWASKHIKSKVGVSLCTFFLGILIFIDDYFNCLTVGAVMRPVSDDARVSREKLAYLIDATAAPICMIAPISSWAAAVAGYVPDGQGISMFIKAIPYNFYSLLTFVFVLGIIFLNLDYGPMKEFERIAAEEGIQAEDDNLMQYEVRETSKGRVIDLVLPILVLIGVCIFSLVYVGGILDGVDFVTAFSQTDATVGLPWGSMVAMLFTIIYFIARGILTPKDTMECIPKGFVAMVPAILILTLATSLKNLTAVLDSTGFVEHALGDVAGLNTFLPAIIFILACVIAFATGTSWGTFGILIPIVLAIFPVGSEMGVICMSACLGGAVCGDHCSPISDTTIMSSAGAQCVHVNHVSSQLPYALTVAAVSFVGYVIAGFTHNFVISLAVSALLLLGVLFYLKKREAK